MSTRSKCPLQNDSLYISRSHPAVKAWSSTVNLIHSHVVKYPDHWCGWIHVGFRTSGKLIAAHWLRSRGGSLVAHFLAHTSDLLRGGQVVAAVRSREQAGALSKLGISVLQLDLSDEHAVTERVLQYNSTGPCHQYSGYQSPCRICWLLLVSIIIHTANTMGPRQALPLINALSKQKLATGRKAYFIHASPLFLSKVVLLLATSYWPGDRLLVWARLTTRPGGPQGCWETQMPCLTRRSVWQILFLYERSLY